MSPPLSSYNARKTGEPCTKDFRIYLATGDELISPWHGVPLFPSAAKPHVVSMLVQIPRWSNVRLEIAKEEFLTPIRQAIQNDHLQYIPNIFPHKGYPWNYGCLPQTWQDPNLPDPHTQVPGDGGPLDVCELAGAVEKPGIIKQVKVLGAFAVLDNGQTDWKVIVVDVASPLTAMLHGIEDVETHMPGYLATMKEWFRVYKIPEGKGENVVAFGGGVEGEGLIISISFTLALITRCHGSWKKILAEPGMETKVSMSDIDIKDINLARQLQDESHSDRLQLADRTEVEKYHFLSPNWPLAASCPNRAMEV
ncbi:hypothetical protein NUU61_002694 [Penicillium alfredii]|uniref:inorganic diphosphatase n=1 Tax=Penicillium alfredii TaxID=1506179 RepID=A0A9W9KHH2_9EURO|nr:uncharacterized protein NUU61_002694 [Penicillium alfredii]KAJ5105347.1 hypothetical protein NUU61_002694 [Penicillium alfredii]